MLQTIIKIFRYLANLQWTERFQKECDFCDHTKFERIITYDDLPEIMAVENRTRAGKNHWLIMPIEHIRDIENLSPAHLELLRSMNDLKHRLLNEHDPDVPPSEIHSGYHRGRWQLIWNIYYPDTISIHHLHLHVIVRPQFLKKWFKYPPWLPLMWKSDEKLLREVEMLASKGK
ncbi:hypothetical protein V8C43DRAFT_282446 [Trichoderma afarasin]